MSYEMERHVWAEKPLGGIPVCKRCGLLALKNPLTEWAIKRGCDHQAHPDWPRVRVELVRQHTERRGKP